MPTDSEATTAQQAMRLGTLSFDFQVAQLQLDHHRARLLIFGGIPWFQAKPVAQYLTNITEVMRRLRSKDKKCLGDLIKEFGMPTNVFSTTEHPWIPNQNDLKSMFFNEPGFYDMAFSSRKTEAERGWLLRS